MSFQYIFKNLLIVILLTTYYNIFPSHAQLSCSKIKFKEGNAKGCVGMIVTLTDNDPSIPDVYFFEHTAGQRDFKLGNRQSQGFDNSHLFTKAGIYAIRGVFGSGGGAQSIDCLGFVEIVEDKAPDIKVLNCQNRKLAIIVNNFDEYEDIFVDFGDNSSSIIKNTQKQIIHTYTSENNFIITAKGRFSDGYTNCTASTFNIKAQNSIQNFAFQELSINSNTNVSIKISDNPNTFSALMEKKEGESFTEITKVGNGITAILLENRDLKNNIYYYQVQTPSICSSEPVSRIISTVYLNGESWAKENHLEWQRYWGDDFEKYIVYRDGAVYKEISNKEITEFSDIPPNIKCQQTYQYQIVVQLTTSAKVKSNLSTIITSSTIAPNPPFEVVSSVEEGKIKLSWKSLFPDSEKVVIEKIVENQVRETKMLTGNNWIDANVSPSDTSYCYQISIKDDCNNLSSKVKTCPILLKGVKEEFENELSWTSYQSFGNQANYTLEVLEEDYTLREEISLSREKNTFIHPKPDLPPALTIYRIKVSNLSNENLISYSNEVIIEESISIQAPDAFTPNGDGLNDTFQVIAKALKNFKVEIFDRWGRLVFASENTLNQWDGTIQGNDAPLGVYVYIVSGADNKGKKLNQKGSLLLMR
jgi:gliding motility-associated-like protein